LPESGHFAGFWRSLLESGRKRPDLGQLTGNRPSWPVFSQLAGIPPFWEDPGRTGRRFGQNGWIRPDAGGPARLPETRPFRPDSSQSGRNLALYLQNSAMSARFQHRLESESSLSKSDNIQLLECKGRLRCLKKIRLHLPYTENDLRF